MLFSLTMFPVGNGPSIRKPVAEVIDVLDRWGLHYEVSATDTVIEGEWDRVLPAIRDAEQTLRAKHGRVFTLLTVDDYADGENRIHEAVEDVERELHHAVRH